MALVVADRVQETTTTSGTGTLSLAGAIAGYRSFVSGIGSGNTTYYVIYDQTAQVWEVGIGTVTSGTPDTLSRDTVLSNSSGSTAKINLAGNTAFVFCSYPAEKSVNLNATGNVTPLGTITSGTWNATTIGVAYGGTGVTASSGANSVVLRDADQNIAVNSVTQALAITTATAGTTSLLPSSPHFQVLVGTGTHTFKLPDATTLAVGSIWTFDNDSTGNLFVVDNATGALDTVPPGGYAKVFLEDNSTVAGTWARYGMLPSEVNWGTNSLDLGGSTVVTNGTWQGNAIQSGYGGTGLTTFVGANNALYSTSASDLTAGTLPVAAGGTGLTSGTSGGVPYYSASGTLASSGALAANNFVIGGGAGAAPSTTSLLALSAAVTTGNFVKAAGYADTVTALGNTGTAVNIDATSGGVFTATLTGNCTFTLRYPVSSGASSFILILTNDGTAGRTVAFSGGTFRYPGGSVSRTTTANAVDIWFFMTPDAGTTWYVSIPMANLS